MRMMKPLTMGALVLILLAAGWLLRGVVGEGTPRAAKSHAAAFGRGGPPRVTTAKVEKTPLVPPARYVGHVEAIQDAELYAQIGGIIKRVDFKEGATVQEGDLLFTIDPDRYAAKVELFEATLAQTKASLSAAQAALDSVRAQLTYADSYHQRLKKAGRQSVIQADVDKARSEVLRYGALERQAVAKVEQLKAQVKQSAADLQVAKIDLGYTQVRAPITGRIGRAEVTVGDYVSAGSVLMARVVQEDPVRVRFAMSDRDYLNLYKIRKRHGLDAITAKLILSNGDDYQGKGTLDFVGNRMNTKSGTIDLRLRYANTGGELVPGSYVKVLVQTTAEETAPAVPQEAIATDQKGEYVYVVGSDGVALRRDLKLGDSVDGKRIVLSGLKTGENVVIKGIQYLRSGQKVTVANSEAKAAGKDSRS